MAFSPIVYPPQFHVAGEPASGYYLKAYKANTTTAIQLATDRTGGTLVNKIQLNSEGRPEVSGNTIIPHVDQENKLALYPTEAAADADDTNSAIWIPDKIDVGSLPASYVDSIDTLSDLRNYSGESRTILLEGSSSSGDGDGALYYYSSGQSAGTYTDNGNTIIVPTGGDGSAAYLLIQMSHPDDLEYPVSTTTSGGTAGINYTVSDWPDTLVSGRTYYARAHESSIGSYSIDPGGGAITVLRPDGTATHPLDWPKDTIMGFRYDGTNLIQAFLPDKPQYQTPTMSSGSELWTKIASIRFTSTNDEAKIHGRIWREEINSSATNLSFADFYVLAHQQDALSTPNDPVAMIWVKNNTNPDEIEHTGFAAHFSTVSASENVIDIYKNGRPASTDTYQFKVLEQYLTSASVEISYFSNSTAATEATITGGTFDVTSQAAVGEVVEDTTFSLGGDLTGSARLIAVRASSGYQVTLYVDDCSHSASSAPSSSLTAIPSSYRPSRTEWNCYHADTAAVKMIRATSGGAIQYDYTEWDGTGVTPTNTNTATISYYVSD